MKSNLVDASAPTATLPQGGSHRTPKKKADYEIKSVSNALDLLEALAGKPPELGVTELAKRLSLHKNNVFRLLATLELRGYVEQNEITENYRLGLKPLQLGKAFQKHCGLSSRSREITRQLVAECNETVSIGVFRGGKVIYVDVEETAKSVRVVSRLGAVLPAHCTSIGKVMLAFRSREENFEYLKESPLKPYTRQTITDPQALMHQLDQIRRQGYATDNEEFEDCVKCVAVPIRNHTQQVVAGMSLSGPAHRFPDHRQRDELIPLIVVAGRELSRRLGYDMALG